MSQKHYNLFASIDFAWFNQQPPFRDFFADLFNRWTASEKEMPVSVDGNPTAFQMRAKNIASYMSQAQSLATIGFDKYINDKSLFPNPTPFYDMFGGGGVSMDIQQYEIKKYGYPRNMLTYNKDVSYYPSARYWYLAAMNGLWYYADPIDKAIIEWEWRTRPDAQDDNGLFSQIIRNVATPYLEYLSYAGAVVTVATVAVAFAQAAPIIASQITGAAGAGTTAAGIAESGAVGTTLAEATVTIGAESAVAAGTAAGAGTTAAASGGFFSTIGSVVSAETVAGLGTLGALAEAEAKKALEKEGEKAITNLISGGGSGSSSPGQQQPISDAVGGSPVAKAPEINQAVNFGALGGVLALLLFLL